MRKNFLFAALTVLLAGFWFGGASLATGLACSTESGAVACIGDTWYSSLSDAISEAVDGATIKLINNYEVAQNTMLLINNNKDLTIDWNWNTINWSSNWNTTNHTILIWWTGNITLSNLIISGFGDDQDVVYSFAISPLYTSASYKWKLTLNWVGIEKFNRQAIVIGNGEFEINNCVFTGKGEENIYQQGILIYNWSWTITNTDISGIRAGSNDDTYGILLAGDWTVDVSYTNIFNSDAAVAVSPTDANWASALEITTSSWRIILWEWNNFEWNDVISIVPMGTDGVKTDSTIEITAGTYLWEILIDENITGNASIEIQWWTFSEKPDNSHLAAWKKAIKNADNKWEVVDGFTVTFDPDNGEDVRSGDVASWATAQKPETDPTKDGYEFTWWYNWTDLFDFTTPITADITLTGKWLMKHTISFDTAEWTPATIESEVKLDWEKVTKHEATKTWNVLVWWLKGEDEYDFDKALTSDDDATFTLTAKWEAIAPSTWEVEDESFTWVIIEPEEWLTWTDTQSSIEAAVASNNSNATMQWAAELNVYKDVDGDGTKDEGDDLLNKKVNFSGAVAVRIPVQWEVAAVKVKVRHNGETTFGTEWLTTDSAATCNDWIASAPYNGSDIKVTSWYAEIYTCSASTFIAYTETAKPAPSYSWGGGGSSSSSSKAITTDTKATTGDNKTVDNNKTDETKADETKTDENNWTNGEKATDSKYSQEMIDAYNWAFKNGITTMPSIDEADMEGGLTRIAMAKMLSQYAINILGKTPDTSKVVPAFPDVTAQMDADYSNGVTLAYQLGIMWIGIETFRPNDLVTRAEFATALSRLLFNTPDGEDNYYTTHLQKLMDEKIITVDTPDLQELRGYVMIMLMRSANS